MRFSRRRSGKITVLFAVMLPVICAFIALAVDAGYLLLTKARMQAAADAAALASAASMNDGLTIATQEAVNYAELNAPNQGEVLKEDDVEFGTWDPDGRVFTASLSNPTAVRVVVRRATSNENAARLFFARVFGNENADVSAEAIAYSPPPANNRFRFLIDDEMFDTDEKPIEDIARRLGKSPDALLSDPDRDGFINLPVGERLELPTGQVGDEALFDVTSYEGKFPFKDGATYDMVDFLAEGTALETSLRTTSLDQAQWNSSNAPHKDLVGKKVLDPALGVEPAQSHSNIMALPDANVTHASPVYKSDVSMQERSPSKYGSPAANLLGERRGLVAFKIISARSNPKGGSYLPLLTIEIVDPRQIDLESLTMSNASAESGKSTLVY